MQSCARDTKVMFKAVKENRVINSVEGSGQV